MKPVTISDPAKDEFREITRWYREKDERVAARFIAEARRVLTLLEQFPQIRSRVPGVEDAAVREIAMRKFPYRVIFVDLGDHLEVAAFAHKRRGPVYLIEVLRRL